MKVLHWIGAGFILFALAFALAGYAVGAPARALRANGYTVAATVVNADARHDRTTFAYAAGGEAHETTLNVYSSAFSTGVRIPLYVSADGPSRIATPVGESIASVFNILSMAFAAVGLSLFALSLVCRVRRQRLLTGGERITAQIVEVRPNPYVTVNGRHPYQLLCRAVDPATGRERCFLSESLRDDPAPDLRRQAVDVYPNPRSSKRYAVDVESALR